LRKLQKLEKKQKSEILRLQKELERVNKTWEMKVTILQQTLHALKDESFLRTTLQRQAARLQHAAVAYASDGPAVIVSNRRIQGKTYRTLERPGGTKETIPYKKADRLDADSPFSEDRPTPAPPAEGEPPLTSNGETSMNANPGSSGIISREVKNESSSLLLESSTPAKPVVDAV